MSSSWGDAWGYAWSDSWGPLAEAGSHAITGVGGIPTEEAFGSPRIKIHVTHVIVGEYLPELATRRHKITGVGGIESEEMFGRPIVTANENEMALLLLAA